MLERTLMNLYKMKIMQIKQIKKRFYEINMKLTNASVKFDINIIK